MDENFNENTDLSSLLAIAKKTARAAEPLLAIKSILNVYVAIGQVFNEFKLVNKIYELEEAIPAIESLLSILSPDEVRRLSEAVKIPQIQGFDKLRATLEHFLETSRKRVEVKKSEKLNLISNKVFQTMVLISKDLCRERKTKAKVNVGKKENEEIGIILRISDEEGYALSKPISQFDSLIISAVYTLFHNGNITFSAKDIYETLTGGRKRPEKSPTLLPQIENSLDKLASVRVTIDLTEQAKQHKYEMKNAVLQSYLLPLEKVQVLFKGSQQVETAYKLIRLPAIFEYSQCVKQFITIPIEFLKLDKATPELICLRIAVLKRVFCICYGNMKYNRLAIETLFKEAGIEIQYKTQKQRYIKAIKQTLELLKDKKFLEDFTTVTKNSEGQKGRPTLQSFQLVPIFKNKELNSPS